MPVGNKMPKRNSSLLVLIIEESKAQQRSWSMDIYISFLCMPLRSSIQKAQKERDMICIRTGEGLSNWRELNYGILLVPNTSEEFSCIVTAKYSGV